MVQGLIFIITFIFISKSALNLGFENLGYLYGCDIISFGLILLRFWICSLIVLARGNIYKYKFHEGKFMLIVVILIIMLYCTFRRLRLFSFYLFFEGSLIPTLFLILG